MPIGVICTGCKKNLQVPDSAVGKTVSCPLCKAQFVVPAAVSPPRPAPPAAPPPPALAPVPPAVSKPAVGPPPMPQVRPAAAALPAAPPGPPARLPAPLPPPQVLPVLPVVPESVRARMPPPPRPVRSPGPRPQFRPLRFRLLVIEDSRNELKDYVQTRLTPEGLTLMPEGRPPIALPVGTPARSDGNAIFTVWSEGRTISLQVQDKQTKEIPFGNIIPALLNDEMADFYPEHYRLSLVGRLRERQEIGRLVRRTKILFIPWSVVAAILWWMDKCGFGRGWEEGAARGSRVKFWGGLALVVFGPPLFFFSCTGLSNFMKARNTKPDQYVAAAPPQDPPADGPLAENAAHKSKVTVLCFSPDGKQLASGSEDEKVKLWKVPEGTHLGTLDGHKGSITIVVFSPDGKTLASAAADKTIRFWDIDSRQEKSVWQSSSVPQAMSFSTDSQLLATNSDNEIVLLEPGNGKPKQVLKGHTAKPRPVFSPKGNLLASPAADGTIKLWDATTFAELKMLTGHTGAVKRGLFSPDGAILATTGSDNTVKLWDPVRYQDLATLKEPGHQPDFLAFSPDGSVLASAGPDAQVHVWDVAKRQLRCKVNGYIPVFSPDSKVLATCSNHHVHYWDVANGKKTGEFDATVNSQTANISILAAPPAGDKLAVGYLEFVKLWPIQR